MNAPMPEIPDRKYSLVSEIGRGSAGTVYNATGSDAGDRFAVKVFHAPALRCALPVQTELKLLSRLRHPHIVPVVDFGVTVDHRPYWVMPLIQTIPLETFRAALTPERVKEYIVQVCQALDYLHQSSVIHGDLKPDNILIEASGDAAGFQVRLVDFGMARMTRSGRSAARGGSFPYMAPECLARGWADPRSDLFSLGVVLAEVIRGEPLFNTPAKYRMLMQDKTPVETLACPEPYQALCDIARQLAAANPDARPLSALDVIQAADPGGKTEIRRGYIVPPRFTGRDTPLQTLTDAAAEVRLPDSPGCAYILDGITGSGFTRLLREFHARCRMNDLSCRYYQCGGVPGGGGGSNSGMFGDIAACFDMDTHGQRAASLEKTIRNAATDGGPAIWCLDDIHCADRGSRFLFQRLIHDPPPGLLIAAAGVVDMFPGGGRAPDAESGRVHRLTLAPLTLEDTHTLIRSRFVPAAPDALVEMIGRYAGRLPAAINRCIDTFHRLGFVSFERNAWRQKQVPEMDTLTEQDTGSMDPVRWQISTLEPDLRKILLETACLGNHPAPDLIVAVLDITEDRCIDILEILTREQLLSTETGRVALCSPAIRAIAQETISAERQQALHAAAADYLESADGDPVDIGFHRIAAGMVEHGLKDIFHGAVSTLRNGSIDAALALFDRMQTVIKESGDPDLARTFHWKIGLERGNALVRSGDPDNALKTFTAALELTEDPGERSLIMGNIAMTRLRTGDTDTGLTVLKEAAQLAARAEHTAQHAVLQAQLGNLYYQKDRLKDAAAAYRTALPLLETTENQRVAAAVWNNLGSVREMMGDIDVAFTAYTRAMPLKRRLGDRLGEAVLRHNIGHILMERGRLRAARIQLEKASRSLRDQGETPHLIQFLGNLSLLDMITGRYREAAGHLASADPRLRDLDDDDLLIWLLSIKGRLYTVCGHPEIALTAMEPGRESLRNTESPNRETLFFMARYLQALAAADRSDPGLDERLAAALTSSKDPLLRCELLLAGAAGMLRRGDLDGAEQAARKTRAVAEANGLLLKKCSAIAEIAAIHLLGNQPGSALKVLEPAEFMALEKAGARPLLARWTALAATAYDRLGQRTAAGHADARAERMISDLIEALPAEVDPERFRTRFMLPPVDTAEIHSVPPAGVDERHGGPGERIQAMEDRRKLQLLLDISRGLNLENDLGVLLRRIVDHALDLTGADRGFLYLKSSESDEEIVVTRNIRREAIFGSHAEISTSILDEVMRTRQPVLLSDTLSDEDFSSRQSILTHNLRTVMCAPLMDPYTGTVEGPGAVADGVLYVDGTAGTARFTALDREVFEALASHAAVGLANLRQKNRLSLENRSLKQQIRKRFSFDQLIGTSAPMLALKTTLEKVAPSHAGVLILGESGTGKELVARTLHTNSPRENGPFLSINCAALAESVLESELFGVEAGVATGVKRRAGLFVQADSGTLFLDEIGDMPLTMQAKILRVLQERRVRPVGASRSRPIDVRVICATNKNLWQAVRDGTFREDLLYRIDVISLRLPPLRERIEDIPVLARFFLNRYARQMHVPVPGLSLAALRCMAGYSWPGNVRELENQIQRALVLSDIGRDIEPDDLSPRIAASPADSDTGSEHSDPSDSPVHPVRHSIHTGNGFDIDTENGDIHGDDMKSAVAALETRMILNTLKRTGGNKTETARILGLSREGLRLKMQRLNIIF